MNTPKVDFLALLGVLEIALILMVVALVFVFRSKALAGRVRALQEQLKNAGEGQQQIAFDQYLRDEIIRNQGLEDEAAASENEDERDAAGLLEMRRKFLELEVAAQESERNPVEFRNRIAAGMQELIEELRPDADTVVVEQAVVEESTPAELTGEPSATEAEEQRAAHDTHDEEMDHLRQVIYNQQDAMALLRAQLEGVDSENIEEILAKLDQFEKESRELHQSMEVLEAENERLKQTRARGESLPADAREAGGAALNGLRSMLGNQQTKIASLENLIRELAPDAKKAKELEDALASIQKANQELNGCVAVLEDENAMLREELGEIQAYLDQQDKLAEADAEEEAPAEDSNAPSVDDVQRELEIKVQELEALVEFKDAAIEELEKQYNKLQSKYLEETGKKAID